MATDSNRHALIAAGGDGIAFDRLAALAQEADIVVAADAGLRLLRQAGIQPDIVIGDLDSLRPDELATIDDALLRHETGQDDTDLEKAIRYCLTQGARRADIVGGTGRRLDHSFNAVNMLVRYGDRLSLTLHDRDGWAERITVSPLSFGERVGERVSIIPAPEVCGLTSAGLRYPLNDLDLFLGSRDAVSNEVVSIPVKLRWAKGSFLLYHQIP